MSIEPYRKPVKRAAFAIVIAINLGPTSGVVSATEPAAFAHVATPPSVPVFVMTGVSRKAAEELPGEVCIISDARPSKGKTDADSQKNVRDHVEFVKKGLKSIEKAPRESDTAASLWDKEICDEDMGLCYVSPACRREGNTFLVQGAADTSTGDVYDAYGDLIDLRRQPTFTTPEQATEPGSNTSSPKTPSIKFEDLPLYLFDRMRTRDTLDRQGFIPTVEALDSDTPERWYKRRSYRQTILMQMYSKNAAQAYGFWDRLDRALSSVRVTVATDHDADDRVVRALSYGEAPNGGISPLPRKLGACQSLQLETDASGTSWSFKCQDVSVPTSNAASVHFDIIPEPCRTGQVEAITTEDKSAPVGYLLDGVFIITAGNRDGANAALKGKLRPPEISDRGGALVVCDPPAKRHQDDQAWIVRERLTRIYRGGFLGEARFDVLEQGMRYDDASPLALVGLECSEHELHRLVTCTPKETRWTNIPSEFTLKVIREAPAATSTDAGVPGSSVELNPVPAGTASPDDPAQP
jgi:hypothetical protein